MSTKKSDVILYLHVSKRTKKWLKALCSKEASHVSQSAMAERIFAKARKKTRTLKVA